jgi:hypothetical protein
MQVNDMAMVFANDIPMVFHTVDAWSPGFFTVVGLPDNYFNCRFGF